MTSGKPATPIQERLDRLFAEAKRWSIVWGLSRLARDVTIEFSEDPGSALGLLDLRTMSITLNMVLLRDENEALLFETLCHEMAHAVVARRHGLGAAEHGPEWSEFMEKAGFAPRPVIAAREISGLPRLN